MKNFLTILFCLTTILAIAQDDRVPLVGKVIYLNTDVPNENVINVTAETATATNDNGEFIIAVKEGDILAFTSLNYQFKTVTITRDILNKNRLVVTVDEKITELDEVVITPENREKFLELKGEEFKKIDYQTDLSTRVENQALSIQEQGMQYGLNFVNIFKAIFNAKAKDNGQLPEIKVSEILRQVYDDEFFVTDLQIPQDKINEFLYYVDANTPPRELLRKDQEFQLIDYLVNQSKAFQEALKDGQ